MHMQWRRIECPSGFVRVGFFGVGVLALAFAGGVGGCAAGKEQPGSLVGAGGAFTAGASSGGGSGGSGGDMVCDQALVCGDDCVDPSSNLRHCGACDAACVVGQYGKAVCDNGLCRILCDDGYADCDKELANGCEVELAANPMHCGACGLAPVEICNGIDDNCNGAIDEGCPSAIVLGGGNQSGHAIHGNLAGGAPFSEACSPGFAIYRFSGHVQGNIDRIQAHCGRVELAVDKKATPYAYRVVRGSEETLSLYGGYESTPYDVMCSADQFVVGISGEASKDGVHDLTIHCAEILVTGDAGSFELSHGPVSQKTIDGSFVGTSYLDILQSPALVDRYQGRSGLWLDAVGIGESKASLMLSP
jgi:hypothetical protein